MSLLKNKKKVEANLTKARDKKCEPISQEIIQIIARHNPKPETADFEHSLKTYGPIQKDINALMKEKNLSISEANFTWSVVQATLDIVRRLSTEAIQYAFEIADSRLWKKENIKDVTLQDIDNMLK